MIYIAFDDQINLVFALCGENEVLICDFSACKVAFAICHISRSTIINYVSMLEFAKSGEGESTAVNEGCLPVGAFGTGVGFTCHTFFKEHKRNSAVNNCCGITVYVANLWNCELGRKDDIFYTQIFKLCNRFVVINVETEVAVDGEIIFLCEI